MKRLFYTMMLAVLSLPVMAGNADSKKATANIIGDEYECVLVDKAEIEQAHTLNKYQCNLQKGDYEEYMPQSMSLELLFAAPSTFKVAPAQWGANRRYGGREIDKRNLQIFEPVEEGSSLYWGRDMSGDAYLWLIFPEVHVLLLAGHASDGQIDKYMELLQEKFHCPVPWLLNGVSWYQDEFYFENKGQSAPSTVAGGDNGGGGAGGEGGGKGDKGKPYHSVGVKGSDGNSGGVFL